MLPGCGFLGSAGFNYLMHRLGRQTACQWVREHLPPWAAAIAWAGFNAWFIPHLWRGYPRRPKECP